MKQEIWTFVLFWSIPLITGGDSTVTCILTSDCMLPCTSKYHEIIHWYENTNPDPVHSFYDNADNLQFQDEKFKGRTSLFRDQITRGNASLMLRSVQTKDEGRYKCYTATSSDNLEQFILLKVKAPVKWVDLKTTSDGISCSTKDVYPHPTVSWYIDGSSEKNFTVETEGDKERLFSFSSVLNQTPKESTTYSCSITLGDENQGYNASLSKENVDVYPGQDATLHCPVSQENDGNDTITLTFNETSITLKSSQLSQLPTITKQWRGKTLALNPNGTVTIHNLENSQDTGTYTCERSTAQSREVVLTSVQMKSANHHASIGIGVGVCVGVGVIFTIAAIAYCVCRKKAQKKRNEKNTGENRAEELELEPLSAENPSNHTSSPISSVQKE